MIDTNREIQIELKKYKDALDRYDIPNRISLNTSDEVNKLNCMEFNIAIISHTRVYNEILCKSKTLSQLNESYKMICSLFDSSADIFEAKYHHKIAMREIDILYKRLKKVMFN